MLRIIFPVVSAFRWILTLSLFTEMHFFIGGLFILKAAIGCVKTVYPFTPSLVAHQEPHILLYLNVGWPHKLIKQSRPIMGEAGFKSRPKEWAGKF